jgi:hypothetical protein
VSQRLLERNVHWNLRGLGDQMQRYAAAELRHRWPLARQRDSVRQRLQRWYLYGRVLARLDAVQPAATSSL